MLYVPTLNIVSPRARNIKIGNHSSQGKSRVRSMTNNVDKNSDNENVADVDFAKLATLSTVWKKRPRFTLIEHLLNFL
jgi:hypothetical protein